MNCLVCGHHMTSQREAHRYKECGLAITLVDVQVDRCPRCGEYEVVIPGIEALHRAIAMAIVDKTRRLAPEEVRFLRKYLGLSGKDFAARIGVAPETVSRWEKGIMPIGPVPDRLVRLMAIIQTPVETYSLDQLADIGEPAAPLELHLAVRGNGWRLAA